MATSGTDDVRSRAVETVDGRHGYTYEFSGSPAAHLQEYDDEEARLRLDPRGPCVSCGGPLGQNDVDRSWLGRGMSAGGHPLDARGRKVLRRAVRLWRDMPNNDTDYSRGILRGYVMALGALWNIDDNRATARVREMAESAFVLVDEPDTVNG